MARTVSFWPRLGARDIHPSPTFTTGDTFILLLIILIGRIPDIFSNFTDWDEAAMMSQAWAMTKGQILYRDIFQIHAPLNFLVFVPFFLAFKTAVAPHAIKFMNMLLIIFGALMVRKIAYRWMGDRLLACLAACVFANYFPSNNEFSSSFGEFYLIFPILLSIPLLFLNSERAGSDGSDSYRFLGVGEVLPKIRTRC
jgi:hypothetical protein